MSSLLSFTPDNVEDIIAIKELVWQPVHRDGGAERKCFVIFHLIRLMSFRNPSQFLMAKTIKYWIKSTQFFCKPLLLLDTPLMFNEFKEIIFSPWALWISGDDLAAIKNQLWSDKVTTGSATMDALILSPDPNQSQTQTFRVIIQVS